MKVTIYYLSAFLVLSLAISCNNASSSAQVVPEPAPVSKVVKATVPAQKVISNKQEENLVKTFPFDIDLKDVDGKVHKSTEVFKKNGKPTVLFFWLTTCGPCHMKLNAIKPLYPEWKEAADFNAYAISGDYEKNYPKFVKQTKAKGWEWETYNDVNRSFRKILPGGLNGYPQTFIFDKDGELVYQDRKYRPGDEKKLFKKIKEICNS